MKLSDKVALITGNSMGIGSAIALGFAREGSSVALADFKIDGRRRMRRQDKRLRPPQHGVGG